MTVPSVARAADGEPGTADSKLGLLDAQATGTKGGDASLPGSGGYGGTAEASGTGAVAASGGTGGIGIEGSGGAGGDATATNSGAGGSATATGGAGGFSDTATGGKGGAATANASGAATSAAGLSVSASAAAGSGGSTDNGHGGLGGAPAGTATAHSDLGGSVNVDLSLSGGWGGAGGDGSGSGGNGADAIAINATTGYSLSGVVKLSQTTEAGYAGSAADPGDTPGSERGSPGTAGNATSTLFQTSSHGETSFTAETTANGGFGGSEYGPGIGATAGGKGTASTTVEGSGSTNITAIAHAKGGIAGGSTRISYSDGSYLESGTGAQGGQANADASATAVNGNAIANADATAGASGGGDAGGAPGGVATAHATAVSQTGTATADAQATGGLGGYSQATGLRAQPGSGSATATAISGQIKVIDSHDTNDASTALAHAFATPNLSTGSITSTTTTVGATGTGAFTLSGSGQHSATQSVTVNSGSIYNMNGGTLTTPSFVNHGSFNFAGGTANLGAISGTGATSVASGQTMSADSIHQGSVSVSGTLTVRQNGTASGVSKVGTVTIPSGGRLDLSNNKLVVTGQGVGTWNGTAYTDVSGLIANGYSANQDFSGTGIVTSQSAATGGNTLTSLGIASAADVLGLTGTNTALWAGETVTASETLVKYTYAGDANLDGVINGDDQFQIDSGMPAGLHGWFNGDFNYDGVINGDDQFLIDSNISAQGDPITPGASPTGVQAVPEPGGALFLAATCVSFLRRRRRQARAS